MKRIKTELPITIITDDEYKQGDNLEMTRQRIEKAAMLIGSIFSLLKVSALTFEGRRTAGNAKISVGFDEHLRDRLRLG